MTQILWDKILHHLLILFLDALSLDTGHVHFARTKLLGCDWTNWLLVCTNLQVIHPHNGACTDLMPHRGNGVNCLRCPWSLPWCPLKCSNRNYSFQIEVPLTKEKMPWCPCCPRCPCCSCCPCHPCPLKNKASGLNAHKPPCLSTR